MSKPSAREPSAPSPYVSLREAVRPAIFAYAILAGEREQAGVLVQECYEVVQLTHELLKKSALAHLLTPGFGQQAPINPDVTVDRQARLLEAYADVGLLWAKVVGTCMAIASVLLDREEWAKVNHLADVLAEAGETASAKKLSLDAEKGRAERVTRQIKSTHNAMSIAEIKATLELMINLPKNFPNLNIVVAGALSGICTSVTKKFPNVNLSTCGYITRNGCPPQSVGGYLPEVYAEFSRVCATKSG
jgi:hypothetical protein